MSDSAPRAGRPSPPKGFWVIWSTVAIDQVVFAMILPVLPLLAREHGAGPLTVTALVSVFAVAQFVLSPVVGALSDRVGRKPVLIVALVGSAIGSLILGIAGTLPLLFVGRAVDGMSGTALVAAQSAITDMVPPRDRARYLGLMGSAFAFGFIVGPGLSGVLSLANDRLPFFVAAGLGAANALAALFRLPETRPAEVREAATHGGLPGAEDVTPLAPFRRARVLTPAAVFYIAVLVAGLFAFAAVEGGTFTLFADDTIGLDRSSISFVYVIVGLVLAGVQVGLVGPVNRRLGTRGTVVAAMAVNTVGFGVIAAAQHVAVLIAGVACNAIGQGLMRPTCTAAVSNAVPGAHRGAAIGVQTSAQGLVRIVGPLEAGALYQSIGPAAPFVAAAGIAAGTAAVAATAGKRFDAAVAADVPSEPGAPGAPGRVSGSRFSG